jgi:hypothetical protein
MARDFSIKVRPSYVVIDRTFRHCRADQQAEMQRLVCAQNLFGILPLVEALGPFARQPVADVAVQLGKAVF